MLAGRRGRAWASDSVTTASGGTAGGRRPRSIVGPARRGSGSVTSWRAQVTVARPRDDAARAARSRRRARGLVRAFAVVLVAVVGLLLGGDAVAEWLPLRGLGEQPTDLVNG